MRPLTRGPVSRVGGALCGLRAMMQFLLWIETGKKIAPRGPACKGTLPRRQTKRADFPAMTRICAFGALPCSRPPDTPQERLHLEGLP